MAQVAIEAQSRKGDEPLDLLERSSQAILGEVEPAQERDAARKTCALLRERFVAELARGLLGRDEFEAWWSAAVRIQEAVYHIDFSYESNAKLSSRTEQPLWDSVRAAIVKSNGNTSFAVWRSFANLRKYASAERRIHSGDIIDPREFDDIARLKASDVSIARSLIWSYCPRQLGSGNAEFWSWVDQCGELAEDLADIAEDGRDWNLNLWLYSYMVQREASESVRGASATLRRVLANLEAAYCQLSVHEKALYEYIYRKTVDAGVACLERCGRAYKMMESGLVIPYALLEDSSVVRRAQTGRG